MMERFTARLEARDAARNLWRAYTLEAGRDLFGAWVVEVSYGRIGRPGRTLVRGGGDGERLVVALTRLVARSPLVTHALG